MIPNGTTASKCIVRWSCGFGLLEPYVADGQITSPTPGYCVLDQSQDVSLLHPRASSVPPWAFQ